METAMFVYNFFTIGFSGVSVAQNIWRTIDFLYGEQMVETLMKKNINKI
jgi:hypothetical protein